MANIKYKSHPITSIFRSGTGYTFTNYKNANSTITFLSKFPNLPDQTLGFKVNGSDIGSGACPKFTKYTTDQVHTCDSRATSVYIIAVGGGGGGGGGGSTGGNEDSYHGDGGGGGGGATMSASRFGLASNSTIAIPITITFNIGAGGAGGGVTTNNVAGKNGTAGEATTSTINRTSGNDAIVLTTPGGSGGTGGGSDTTANTVSGIGGDGGDVDSVINSNWTDDQYRVGNKGSNGAAGTASDTDKSDGGAGGASGYSASGKFLIETPFTFGNGGKGGQGDQENVAEFGAGGAAGQPGVAYVFEYFD